MKRITANLTDAEFATAKRNADALRLTPSALVVLLLNKLHAGEINLKIEVKTK